MIDGGLRPIFRKRLPHMHWQSVETGSVGRGIPDSNCCHRGIEFWIEFKTTNAWSVDLRPEQIAWLLRRHRAGGRVFVGVRRQVIAGPRKGPAVDELWLVHGWAAAELRQKGLKKISGPAVIGIYDNGPASWPWDKIERALLS